MTLRYLVSYHDVNTSQPIRDVMGALICFTTLQPNGKFAAVLTRLKWDLLRATRWTSPIQDIGFLIPDVDFQANDGKIFTTLEECAEHEQSLFLNEEEKSDAGAACCVFDDIHASTDLTVLESRILTAVSQGSVHTKDLREQLEVSGEDIKAVVSASQFLVWKGPRVALAAISTPS
jgi:hypothetical protein